ncbi:MAG: DUF268 domain-containing protein [Deltaproteobacteria bacterium]|nr:DUF268 domain-containing protein [Deltaproteobacteria bacterium]
MRGHYFWQDLFVAQRIFKNNPALHVDVGSRIDGFVAHVASFRKIEVLDIRPLETTIDNVTFVRADMMAKDLSLFTDYCDSLSCLHALEHFGLGRYGDPIDPDGYLTGIENINRMLKSGGKLYLSVPIGPQRVEFNAHRVFEVKYILDLMSKMFKLDMFSYIDDKGNLHKNVAIEDKDVQSSFGCHYGCGIFEFTRLYEVVS